MDKNVEIDQELCTGCGACVKMCPARILYIDKVTKTAKVSNDKACDLLAGCMRVCKVGAMKINRPAMSFGRLFGF